MRRHRIMHREANIDFQSSQEPFTCFLNDISALQIKLPASTAGSCSFIAEPGIKRQSHRTCWLKGRYMLIVYLNTLLMLWNLASRETAAEHIELSEYRYEDIESCTGKQTLISRLLRQPKVQRFKSDNVEVRCLYKFWQNSTNRHYKLQSFLYAAVRLKLIAFGQQEATVASLRQFRLQCQLHVLRCNLKHYSLATPREPTAALLRQFRLQCQL